MKQLSWLIVVKELSDPQTQWDGWGGGGEAACVMHPVDLPFTAPVSSAGIVPEAHI
jgi:hypothetical protein